MKTLYLLLMATALLALLINRRQLDKRLHLFIPMLILGLLTDGLRTWPGEDHPISQFFFALYTPAEYMLQALVVYSYLSDPLRRKFVLRSIPVFVTAGLFIQLWLKNQDSFYQYGDVLLQTPLVCMLSLLYFAELADSREATPNWSNPMFIISFAHLLFYSVGFFSYGFRSYFESTGKVEYAEIVAWIGRVFNIVMYMLYIVAFTISWHRRPPRYSY